MMTCTLNDDSSAQGGDRENCSVGEDTPNMCKDVVIETEIDASQVENDFHEDVKLQSELRFQHTLDVSIDGIDNIETLSQSKDRLTRIKVGIFILYIYSLNFLLPQIMIVC